MTSNGSPSYVLWTTHVDFQMLWRCILEMRTKTDMEKVMVVMADEKKLLLQEKKWIAAGSNYFSRNFGWPLRGVGGNLNGQWVAAVHIHTAQNMILNTFFRHTTLV